MLMHRTPIQKVSVDIPRRLIPSSDLARQIIQAVTWSKWVVLLRGRADRIGHKIASNRKRLKSRQLAKAAHSETSKPPVMMRIAKCRSIRVCQMIRRERLDGRSIEVSAWRDGESSRIGWHQRAQSTSPPQTHEHSGAAHQIEKPWNICTLPRNLNRRRRWLKGCTLTSRSVTFFTKYASTWRKVGQ